MSDQKDFARLVAALAPWGRQLVFVGGWAHRLYRLHPDAHTPVYQPVATLDADVAFDARAKLDGSIKEQLAAAGFKEELMGRHKPPVSQYILGDADQNGFYAEFLTPLIGPQFAKDGSELATLQKADIVAQKLRYLDVLLVAPWNVTLGEDWGVQEPLQLRIPNPVSYIAQKLLIHDRRSPEKQPQDILYIHDTIELFGAELGVLAALWRDQVRGAMLEAWQGDDVTPRLSSTMF